MSINQTTTLAPNVGPESDNPGLNSRNISDADFIYENLLRIKKNILDPYSCIGRDRNTKKHSENRPMWSDLSS